MNGIATDDRNAVCERRVYTTAKPRKNACRWYPIALSFQYRAFSGGRLVHRGVGETIDISSHAIRLSMPFDLPGQVDTLDLAVAWPVTLGGATPLQWMVKAKPVEREPGWILACIGTQELRTVGPTKRLAMAACG